MVGKKEKKKIKTYRMANKKQQSENKIKSMKRVKRVIGKTRQKNL